MACFRSVTISLLLSFFFTASSEASGPGGISGNKKDTSHYQIPHQAGDWPITISSERLNFIIDSVFELENISPEMISNINGAIREAEAKDAGPTCNSFPAEDHYSTWDNKNFFPPADALVVDTTIDINLHCYSPPCTGKVNSGYGWRGNTPHNGIDLNLHRGDSVTAAFDGMVRMTARLSSSVSFPSTSNRASGEIVT